MRYLVPLALAVVVIISGCVGQAAPTGSAIRGDQILEFYGEECSHCIAMKPVVAQVESDLGITITKYEVWHDADNQARFREYENIVSPACGGGLGVPAFVNTKTGKAVCGEMTADQLKAFITG